VRLTIVIPAYNEAGRLPATLANMFAFLGGHEEWRPAEVVVVDDGSTDGTATVVSASVPPTGVEPVLAKHERNRGKGAAVRSGFLLARGRTVLLSDADLAAPIAEIDTLAQYGDERTVVIGSRAVDRRLIAVHQPKLRDLMGRIFNLLTRALAVPGIGDTQCGFKLFPGDLARHLAAVQCIDGFAYDVELLLLARRWGFHVREVGVRWSHVDASRVAPFRHAPEMFVDLLRLSWRRATGALPSDPSERP
jgi:dolichyl-phosphate beta-glucosyltransferase